MMKMRTMMLRLFLMGPLGAGILLAQESGSCPKGKLVGLDTRTQTLPGTSNEHYEEKVKKNGKKVIDGYGFSSERTQLIYVLTVTLGDLTYTAENAQNLFFGYNPTDMVVNDPINVCVEKNKLAFIRSNGKKYKATIVRVNAKQECVPKRAAAIHYGGSARRQSHELVVNRGARAIRREVATERLEISEDLLDLRKKCGGQGRT